MTIYLKRAVRELNFLHIRDTLITMLDEIHSIRIVSVKINFIKDKQVLDCYFHYNKNITDINNLKINRNQLDNFYSLIKITEILKSELEYAFRISPFTPHNLNSNDLYSKDLFTNPLSFYKEYMFIITIEYNKYTK